MKIGVKLFSLVLICLSLAGVACRGGQSDDTADAVITVAPPTAAPTATPGSSDASSSISLVQNAWPTPTDLPRATAVPTEVPAKEQTDNVSGWITYSAVGWEETSGANGVLLARDVSNVPNTPFFQISRWSTVLPINSWTAYLPDGVEERDSHATITMGGMEWLGVFVSKANTYRAFYAIAIGNSGQSYSLLVYVPLTGIGDPVSIFDAEAASINTVLRTVQINDN